MNKKSTREAIQEIIYFALIHWNINPFTKGFSNQLSADIMKFLIEKDLYKSPIGGYKKYHLEEDKRI